MARAKPNPWGRRICVLTVEDVTRLEHAWPMTCITNIRARAVISTLFRSQIRVSELCSLRVFDLNLKDALLYVAFGKGDKSRMVGLPATAIPALERWLHWRNNHSVIQDSGSQWLFTQIKGDRAGMMLDRLSINKILKTAAVRAGMDVSHRVHPHGMRHSGASLLLDYDCDLFTIQAQLGHQNIGTTFNYLHKVNPKRIKEQISHRRSIF